MLSSTSSSSFNSAWSSAPSSVSVPRLSSIIDFSRLSLLVNPFRKHTTLLSLPHSVLEHIFEILSEDSPAWEGSFGSGHPLSALCLSSNRLYTLSRPFLWRRLLFVPENMGRRGARALYRLLAADETLCESIVDIQAKSLDLATSYARGRTPAYQSMHEDEGMEHAAPLVELLGQCGHVKRVEVQLDTVSSGVLVGVLEAIARSPSRLEKLWVNICYMINASEPTRNLHYALMAAVEPHVAILTSLRLDHHAGLLPRVGIVDAKELLALPRLQELKLGGHPVLQPIRSPGHFDALRSVSVWNVDLPFLYHSLIPAFPRTVDSLSLSYDDAYTFPQRPPTPSPPRASHLSSLTTVRIRFAACVHLDLLSDILLAFCTCPHTSLELHYAVALWMGSRTAYLLPEDKAIDWFYSEISLFFDDHGFMPFLNKLAVYVEELDEFAVEGDVMKQSGNVLATTIEGRKRWEGFVKRCEARGMEEVELIKSPRYHQAHEPHAW